MYQQDWLLREIELMGAAVRQILNSILNKDPDSALELADEAVGEIMGSDPSLVYSLSPEGLLTMLSAGGTTDEFRARALGETLFARAEALDAMDRDQEASLDRDRSRTLLTAALESAQEPDADRIRQVLGWLDKE
ncbi:MAG: hypothetical protein PF636_09005 [Actinomycetota bacterium]|jgi:hypothetical protein|nr:hypothetical protein [Actinomycetota bacterium]